MQSSPKTNAETTGRAIKALALLAGLSFFVGTALSQHNASTRNEPSDAHRRIARAY